MAQSTTTSSSSLEEIQRMVRQSRLYNPSTRRFLEQAGISAGMKVVDVGCGAGDVTLLIADRVGPAGKVVGVDVNPAILEIARIRTRAHIAGGENVSFVTGDINTAELDNDFDAIVGRLILIHLREPAGILRDLVRYLRPGGIVAFQDFDFTIAGASLPPSPLIERVDYWIKEAFRRAGGEMQMGLKLYHLFLEAGLSAPTMSSEALVIGSNEANQAEMDLVIGYIVNTIRTLLPLLLQFGIATAEDVEIDTLAERCQDELTRQRRVVRLGTGIVSAWARKLL